MERTWPAAAIQRCTGHKLRNLLTHAPRRLHDALRDDYHAIVFAEDGAARRAYLAFLKTWGKGCPGAVTSLEEAGAELLTFYRDPPEPVEGLAHDEQHRPPSSRVPASGEDPGQFSHGGRGARLVHQPGGLGQIVFRKLEGWQNMGRALTIPASTAEEAA